MTRLDLDFDIKREIHNSPIIREIDKSRQRELWRSIFIGVCLVAVVLFSAWQNFQLLSHGYEIVELEKQKATELELNRHLRLEIETLRSPGRIEKIAIQELDLITPGLSDAQILERVSPTPPPGRSVLAIRETGGLSGQQP
ncbi:MAG: hypothetical protein CL484_08010 [Acidobacteria bacterium]|nr:hypothetical protein [Acidobacteriota bacterium]|tara:strand:- start:8 stop:430 length:423 start_codon:yes stop_codon:yes gene_type:complete